MLNTLNADSRFMLFGSRSKNAATDSSDWDFSAAYSEPLVDELIALGFRRVEKLTQYMDSLTSAIFSYVDFNSFTQIHVVLHSDEDTFRRVWNSITPKEYAQYISKQSELYRGYTARETRQAIQHYMNQRYMT